MQDLFQNKFEAKILLLKMRQLEVKYPSLKYNHCDGADFLDSSWSNRLDRIADHNTLRQQLRLSLAIANTRAASLLSPPAESTLFGVQEERFLKAEKFSLAVRLRDLRVGLEKGKNEMVIGAFRSLRSFELKPSHP